MTKFKYEVVVESLRKSVNMTVPHNSAAATTSLLQESLKQRSAVVSIDPDRFFSAARRDHTATRTVAASSAAATKAYNFLLVGQMTTTLLHCSLE